ncbi:maleate cis-trans isomerase family protein [Verminephrobacter eiseniae]|uniref:maleate cis-trans isomerase family protein n=1 Tax=Verminephrobacter eiseniae TaxID=364317 RepID=UPI0022388564|nr:aspartate/glutamate racemase family protein [Verminephrobacter eiseniae]MCW5230390.1 Asp/Glu racemase [Verminephrobacter eiseniae]MCW5292124.1 Asp/Glu racemase [Verminephrobacter eiseniae]MCW8184802.1 Asp/Glu racemase [Verminephrobacter eiseniae]MCW8222540.1 Asp/Glu racemase [Verminephrobacter eiseniae]MCW8233523.1 Asp/Glu racemase [Verminephrobacter eiseniae]
MRQEGSPVRHAVDLERAAPYTVLPFRMDAGLMARAAIGLVVLASDQTMEYEWRRILTDVPGLAFFAARMPSPADISPGSLAAMEKDIAGAVDLLVPGVALHVVAFGCTSGTIVIGEHRVFGHLRAARPQARCTSPITAAMAGLHQLGARRIALISPYVAAINALFRRHIEADGVQVARIASFNHANDAQVARIDRASLESAIVGAGSAADVDAVFVACTSLRMCELTRDVEQALGKPVISSNSAMAWHALRLAGIDDRLPRWGRLFEQPAGARAGGPDPGRLSQAFFLGSS